MVVSAIAKSRDPNNLGPLVRSLSSSFLVAALGTADTNLHRAAVSAIGLIISSLWWVCSLEAMSDFRQPIEDAEKFEHPRRTRILCHLPLVLIVGWIFSTVVHAMLWKRPLGS